MRRAIVVLGLLSMLAACVSLPAATATSTPPDRAAPIADATPTFNPQTQIRGGGRFSASTIGSVIMRANSFSMRNIYGVLTLAFVQTNDTAQRSDDDTLITLALYGVTRPALIPILTTIPVNGGGAVVSVTTPEGGIFGANPRGTIHLTGFNQRLSGAFEFRVDTSADETIEARGIFLNVPFN